VHILKTGDRHMDNALRPVPAAARRRLLVLAITAGVAFVDWATKVLAAVALDDAPVRVGPVLTLRLGHNPGMAFGLGDRLSGGLLVALTAAVTVVLAVAALRGTFASSAASGLLLGGAVANLADRMIGGTVVDFLDIAWWPSFNVADAALTVGCAWLALVALREPQATPADTTSPT
jgi:signal peptidase II